MCEFGEINGVTKSLCCVNVYSNFGCEKPILGFINTRSGKLRVLVLDSLVATYILCFS